MTITYRVFDHESESIKGLFDLYEATYGDAAPYIERFDWEINQNPAKSDLKIFIAEHKDKIVGATTRFPFKLKVRGQTLDGAFSGNSMIHPDFRRRGIMERLYNEAAEVIPLLYSKGTMPGMYRLLMKVGYQPVYPNTYMTSILSFFRWFLWKTTKYRPKADIKRLSQGHKNGFCVIKRFDDSYDDFWEKAASSFPHILIKGSAYMNWRYIEIPHRKYTILCRKKGERIISIVVLKGAGTTAKIVEILWHREDPGEPAQTIAYVKRHCIRCGFLKLLCWATHEDLRRALKRNFFMDSGETLGFSVYSKKEAINYFTNSLYFHFVEADGDSEYL